MGLHSCIGLVYYCKTMSALQNLTKQKNETDVAKKRVSDWRHEALVDYRALNGLITDDDGMRKIRFDDFAASLGVVRQTLYDWQNNIPDFWDMVAQRRKEIAPRARLNKVHETWYLKAVKGEFQHMQLYLANFDPDFKMPTEKVEHELGNSVLDLVSKIKAQKEIQDRNVIDVTPQTETGEG